MTYKVGVIIGSLSKVSINRKLALALMKLAPENLTLVEIPISDLPLHNRDFEIDYPESVKVFKSAIAEADALIFVTPEYNRSIPAPLKNALDWGSRPKGSNAFSRKPAAIIGASTGVIGTAVAQQHLRNILSCLNCPTLGQPEAFIHMKEGLITEDGEVSVESTQEFLRKWLVTFASFATRFLSD